jgi:hypothetical protein
MKNMSKRNIVKKKREKKREEKREKREEKRKEEYFFLESDMNINNTKQKIIKQIL